MPICVRGHCLFRYFVVSVLADVVPIAMEALVVAEPSTSLFEHRGCRLLGCCLRVVHDLRLSRALTDVRVLVEQTPSVPRDHKVPKEPARRTLIQQRQPDVSYLEFHTSFTASSNEPSITVELMASMRFSGRPKPSTTVPSIVPAPRRSMRVLPAGV